MLVGVVAFAAGGYAGVIESVDRLGEPSQTETHPTYIYSAPLGANEGSRRVIGTIHAGQNRKTTSLEQMPPHLLNALVAKEDERFREHSGVDLWGIMRALWVDIRAGEAVEGASTITQQYVKNAYLTQDQSVTRKVKEALIALEIERREPSKDKIIADYLNTVYFGNNAYGVEAAAQTYFDKSVEDLSISESATLVGLLWSPSTLGQDREGATYQRDIVLTKMQDTGYITGQEETRARETPMPQAWPVNPMVQTGLNGSSATRDFAQLAEDELYFALRGQHGSERGAQRLHDPGPRGPGVGARDSLRTRRLPAKPPVSRRRPGLARSADRTGKGYGGQPGPQLSVQPRHPGATAAGLLIQTLRPHCRPGAGHRT